jgi:uncharacterized protein (TIGR00369 family)
VDCQRELISDLGYSPREGWNDFIQKEFELWYRFDEDITRFVFRAEPKHQNSAGILHGGVLAAYLDHCMGGACFNLSGGKTGFTLQFAIQYLKICKTNRWIFAKVEKQAGSANTHYQLKAEARVNAEEGNLIAEAQGTFIISKNDAKKGNVR